MLTCPVRRLSREAMKIILHIGMSKAGSSAIQKMLNDHREALRPQGFCYPLTGRKWGLAHYEIVHQVRQQNSTEAMERALRECEGALTGILSCEGFWLFSDEQVALLARALVAHETTVVIYLRQPVRYLRSSYRQAVKVGRTILDWSEYYEAVGKRLDYPGVLRRWSRWFQLRVRVYEAARCGVDRDFCALLGLQDLSERIATRRINKTPCDGVLRCILQVNRTLPTRLARPIRSALLAHHRLFGWLPAFHDEAAASQIAQGACANWDRTVLHEFLSPEEMQSLLFPALGGTSAKGELRS